MNDLNSKTRALALSFLCLAALLAPRPAQAQSVEPTEKTDDLDVTDARVEYRKDLDLLVFEQTVAGTAGATTPDANSALDGAPVLGYVFPTTLAPEHSLTTRECQLCHVEEASPPHSSAIKERGFSIIEMEGCET